MKFTAILGFFLTLFCIVSAQAKTAPYKASPYLREVEDHYRKAETVKLQVNKTVTLKLLEKVKKSSGDIQVKKGGRLRWETKEPDHSLIVVNKEAVWLVDYPAEPEEKVAVLKAQNPKKSQPQALVAFLLGQGHITDEFTVKGEALKGDTITYNLKPKDKQSQVSSLMVVVNKKAKSIDRITFEDSVGNLTDLEFKSISFDEKVDDELFKFVPPKGSDVTIID